MNAALMFAGVSPYYAKWASPDIATMWEEWDSPADFAELLARLGYPVADRLKALVSLSPLPAVHVGIELRWDTPEACYNAAEVVRSYFHDGKVICDYLRNGISLQDFADKLLRCISGQTEMQTSESVAHDEPQSSAPIATGDGEMPMESGDNIDASASVTTQTS